MGEAAAGQLVQGVFANVTEGRVAQVMAVGHGFNQVFVEVEGPGNGAANLRHLQAVGQAGHKMVAGGGDENLGFMLEAAEGFAVDYPVPVPLKLGPHGRGFFGVFPALGQAGAASVGRQPLFQGFKTRFDIWGLGSSTQSI